MDEKNLKRDIPLTILVDLLITIVFIVTILYVVAGMESDEKLEKQKQSFAGQIKELEKENASLKKEIEGLRDELAKLKEKLENVDKGKFELLEIIKQLTEENVQLKEENELLKKTIAELKNENKKLSIRAGVPACFGRDARGNHVPTFEYIVRPIDDEIDPEDQEQLSDLRNASEFKIVKREDFSKFQTDFIQPDEFNVPDGWIDLTEFREFNQKISKIGKSQEPQCRLRVLVSGLKTEYIVWGDHRDSLFDDQLYFLHVNQSKKLRDTYEKYLNKYEQ